MISAKNITDHTCCTKPATVDIMTINLRFGLAEDGPNNWIYRKESFRSLFERYQPDFIGMQEANDFQIDYFQEILSSYRFIGQRTHAPTNWQDNIIFYKNEWQCIHSDRFFLSETPSVPSKLPKSQWPRQCIIGMFEKDRRSIVCANTHFDFDDSVQIRSAQIILDRLSRLTFDIPAVLVGDFNSRPGSGGYQALTSPDCTAFPFKDVFESPLACTHHAFTGECKGGRIDWILYRGNIRCVQKEIITGKFRDKYPSDHFPVQAVFEWT